MNQLNLMEFEKEVSVMTEREMSGKIEITSASLLDGFEVENNCKHEWKLIARRSTMCPGELALQDVKWCGICGSLSIGIDCYDTHIYTPNVK